MQPAGTVSGSQSGEAPDARSRRPVRPHTTGSRMLERWQSLRGHATLAFGALALALSALMALGVWLSASQFLLAQREQSTVAQAVGNADQVQRALQTQGIAPPELLSQLRQEIGSTSLLADDGEWFTTSLDIGRDDLPAELRDAVVDGQASRQRITIDDRTMLVVGVPLAGLGQAYFEVFPLEELDDTFRTLSMVLIAAVTTVPLAALVLGWWVTRPALRPLGRVADAAAAIAAGDLGARIDPRGDPELAPIAASFNETAAALERRVRSDARFAADVSHELRTPLTTMLNAVAVLDGYRDCLPQGGQESLELLKSEVDRFTRLVQDLLEISRSDAGNADLFVVEVKPADLVRWTLPSHLRERLVVEEAATDLVVLADKRRLERVVANLVENAEVHGGGLTAVTVTRTPAGAQVWVDDAGPGVPVADRERIFERFARGRGSGRVSSQGAGLGLSLVARHMHLLGGDVGVQDSAHGGARFVLTLPVETLR